MSLRKCEVENCERPRHGRELCYSHARRLRTKGVRGGPILKMGLPLLFAESAASAEQDECLLWPYSTMGKGYGKLSVDGRQMGAHRYVLSLVSGGEAGDLDAAHSCGEPRCVNPRHLRWATRKENLVDMNAAGTRRAKLNERAVRTIRSSPEHTRVLAMSYGVSDSAIQDVRSGRTWKWIG